MRKTHQRHAGARYFETISLGELLDNPDILRRFIADNDRRHPEIVKKLEAEEANGAPPEELPKG